MLITKEVEMKINTKNIKWYRSKGYKCVQGDVIKVKVEHLSTGTHTKIQYKCDTCGEIIELAFSSFILRHEINEKHHCVKCANELLYEEKHTKYQAVNGFKLCKKCNRLLPANTDYYFLKNTNVDGFVNSCKECSGHDFTDKLTKISKDGYKFCSKCDRELPISSKYFEKNKEYKDGLRNVCRECMGDYYRDEETCKSENWSDEDLNLLKSIYKDYTNEELVDKFFSNRTKHALNTQADKGGFAWKTEETKMRANKEKGIKTSKKLKGLIRSNETKKKISEVKIEYYKTHHGNMLGKKLSKEQCMNISKRVKGQGSWKGNKNPRHINPLNGELNGKWQGGITNFYYELRSDTKDWQKESMEYCDYKCVLTNGNFDNIHHLMPFKNIVEETFNICNLDKRNKVADYSNDEFKLLRNTLKELHNKYGFGMCLDKNIHELFHKEYGYLNNTSWQFLDFVYRLDIGEFDNWLQSHNLKLNINYRIIDMLESSLLSQQTA